MRGYICCPLQAPLRFFLQKSQANWEAMSLSYSVESYCCKFDGLIGSQRLLRKQGTPMFDALAIFALWKFSLVFPILDKKSLKLCIRDQR